MPYIRYLTDRMESPYIWYNNIPSHGIKNVALISGTTSDGRDDDLPESYKIDRLEYLK